MKPRLFKSRAGLDAFMASQTDGGAYHVLILHDDRCSPSRCACDPWFEVRDLTVDAVLDGERRQRRWITETAS